MTVFGPSRKLAHQVNSNLKSCYVIPSQLVAIPTAGSLDWQASKQTPRTKVQVHFGMYILANELE